MIDPALLLSAFLIGIFGSGHCLSMCSGIACAPFLAQTSHRLQRADHSIWMRVLVFNSGRLFSYAVIGFLAGTLGLAASYTLEGLFILRSLAALLLVLMGLSIGGWWQGIRALEKAGSRVWSILAPAAQNLAQSPTPQRLMLLGMLWGWLPCGLVYSALAWSATGADPTFSALLMTFFGLGTLPAMLGAGLFSVQIRKLIQQRQVRRVCGGLLILLGLLSFPLWHSGHHHDAQIETDSSLENHERLDHHSHHH